LYFTKHLARSWFDNEINVHLQPTSNHLHLALHQYPTKIATPKSVAAAATAAASKYHHLPCLHNHQKPYPQQRHSAAMHLSILCHNASITPRKPTPANTPRFTSASQRPPCSRHRPSSRHLLASHALPMHLRYTPMLERESVTTFLILDVVSNVYWLAQLKKLLCWIHCQHCDRRTNMILHVDTILQMCKATDLHDQVVKIFNLGSCFLCCLEKPSAKELLRQVKLTLS